MHFSRLLGYSFFSFVLLSTSSGEYSFSFPNQEETGIAPPSPEEGYEIGQAEERLESHFQEMKKFTQRYQDQVPRLGRGPEVCLFLSPACYYCQEVLNLVIEYMENPNLFQKQNCCFRFFFIASEGDESGRAASCALMEAVQEGVHRLREVCKSMQDQGLSTTFSTEQKRRYSPILDNMEKLYNSFHLEGLPVICFKNKIMMGAPSSISEFANFIKQSIEDNSSGVRFLDDPQPSFNMSGQILGF
jgi:hypothetical protein